MNKTKIDKKEHKLLEMMKTKKNNLINLVRINYIAEINILQNVIKTNVSKKAMNFDGIQHGNQNHKVI